AGRACGGQREAAGLRAGAGVVEVRARAGRQDGAVFDAERPGILVGFPALEGAAVEEGAPAGLLRSLRRDRSHAEDEGDREEGRDLETGRRGATSRHGEARGGWPEGGWDPARG